MDSSELKEVLNVENGLLFNEEELSPVFCKPKLIPLKSVTLEKLDKMQKEAVEMMKKMDEWNDDDEKSSITVKIFFKIK